MTNVWVAWKLRERLIQLLRHLMGINTKLLEHLLRNAIGLLHQHPEHVFNLYLDVVAPANFATRRFCCCLRSSSEPVDGKGAFRINAARTDVTSMDGLKEGIERIVWNAEGAPSFDGAQATIIDPIVNDLTGHLQAGSNFVGGKVIRKIGCGCVYILTLAIRVTLFHDEK
jgi:hypothetical protein